MSVEINFEQLSVTENLRMMEQFWDNLCRIEMDIPYTRDLNFPGSNLHELSGDKEGFWSVSVSGNWRVLFKFEDGDA